MADSRSPEVSATNQIPPAIDGSAEATAQFTEAASLSTESKRWGDFQLLQLLGQGSFGEVYRAWDPVLEREIALKLLLPQGLNPEQEYASIVAEARAIARVRHPNIVSVYGVDRREGRVGFWSDFVRGQTLRAWVTTRGPLDARAAAQVGVALCDALAAVHGAGLLHRDIKASNAMRDENGRILLMDFGLSQDLRRITNIAGTPGYMAPEVRAGQPASVQSDIFAMGVLLRFLSTGDASPTDVATAPDAAGAARGSMRPPLTSQALTSAASMSGAVTGLEQVIRKATDPDPKLRFASAAQMGEGLARLLEASPAAAIAPPIKKRAIRPWLAAAVMLLALGAAFGPRLLTRVRTGAPAASTPAYQDYLAAEEALGRYDKPGNTDKAIDLYQKTLQRSPNFALAEAGLAQAYWRKYFDISDNKWADAANGASGRAMEMNPNLAAVEMTVGSIHVDEGKFDLGMQELQQAKQLDDNSGAVHAALAEAYRQQKQFDAAKSEFQTAMDLAPDNWRWPYLLAAMQIDSGDFKAAEQNLNTALEKTPDNARILYNLGVVYQKDDRYPEAQTVLEKAIALDPSASSMMALGRVFAQQGNYEKAIEAYRNAVKVDGSDYDAWGNLATAYRRSGGHEKESTLAYQKAVALAVQQIKSTPDDPYVVSVLGQFYANLHEEKEAVKFLRKALVLAPKDPDVLERVGEAYEELGHRQEAIKYIDQALKQGFSVRYARSVPGLEKLRQDPNAPEQIRETRNSTQQSGGDR